MPYVASDTQSIIYLKVRSLLMFGNRTLIGRCKQTDGALSVSRPVLALSSLGSPLLVQRGCECSRPSEPAFRLPQPAPVHALV